MIDTRAWAGALLAIGLGCTACQQQNEVRREVEDLKQAQREAPAAAEELQKELDQAKAEVVRLEEKTALARQGITDDVIKQRDELKQALKRDEKDVSDAVNKAEGAARTHNTEAEKALKELEQTRAPQVEAEVQTETRSVPAQGEQIEQQQEKREITIERPKVDERGAKTTQEEGAKPTQEEGAKPTQEETDKP